MTLPIRLLTTGLLAACTVAILVARAAPPPAPLRYDPARHLAVVDDPASGRRPLVLDTRTGALAALRLPAHQDLRWGSLSPWVGATGDRDVVGWWTAWSGGAPAVAVQVDGGLARVSFSTGRVVDHIADAPVPSGPPCWDPGKAGRLVYAAGDGQLYQADFRGQGARGPTGPRIRPVAWAQSPGSLSDPFVESICWPDHPLFGGRLLAAVRFKGPDGRNRPARLWWLSLDRSRTEVTQAEEIDLGNPDDGCGYTGPSLHVGPGGAVRLAFQRVSGGANGVRALLVAALNADDLMSKRAIPPAAVRLLAERVARRAAVFAADGRTLWAAVEAVRGGRAVRRCSLAGDVR